MGPITTFRQAGTGIRNAGGSACFFFPNSDMTFSMYAAILTRMDDPVEEFLPGGIEAIGPAKISHALHVRRPFPTSDRDQIF